MALGDGVRRNILTVDAAERQLFFQAILELNKRYYPGTRTDAIPGGVTLWFKQDEIHQSTHVHQGPAFLPWHRELCNRFEQSLRQVNPQLSLHYWDWTTDPSPIFNNTEMGSESGDAGDPLLSAGFYVPGADPYRGDSAFDAVNNNPADPPRSLTRSLSSGALRPDDNDILGASDYPTMRGLLEDAHDSAHSSFIGGTISDPHTAFRDPFVFLLHSNVDRLFATWQAESGAEWRLDPDLVYGDESEDEEILEDMQPWAGTNPDYLVRPWAPPENEQLVKTCRDPSVVAPPCYDTLPTTTAVIEAENPGNVIHFNDVPETETAARAAVFKVYSCGEVQLRVRAGTEPTAPFDVLSAGDEVTVDHPTNEEVRLWFIFTAGALGTAGTAVPDQTVTIECPQNGFSADFTLRANTIERPVVAVMMALDQSGSMDDAAGTSGLRRIQVLQDAAQRMVQVIQPGNGIGLIRFDHDAYAVDHATYPGLPMTQIGTGGDLDPARSDARTAVQNHATNAAGYTSVGDGVALARDVLDDVSSTTYPSKALIVFTDGVENRAQWIDDVAGSIDDRTFAIGLGNESQVDTDKLTALANGTGGYLLLTGLLSSSVDDYYLASKYFLQILAGVTNTSIVTDPSGYVAPGAKVRLPFTLSETDIDVTAIVLQDVPALRFRLEAPDGHIIDRPEALAVGGTFSRGAGAIYYRLNLPVPVGGHGHHAGTWHALIDLDLERFRKYAGTQHRENKIALQSALTHGARYSLIVEALSNLRMNATVGQSAFSPGSTITIRAVLTEFGVPLLGRAVVRAQVARPGGGGTSTVALSATARGVYEGSFVGTIAGVYPIRVMATGTSYRGSRFTREQVATAAIVAPGRGDGSTPRPDDGHDPLCRTLACLITAPGVAKRLDREGIDPKELLEHLRRCCAPKPERTGKPRPR